jgi:hypothetical protein
MQKAQNYWAFDLVRKRGDRITIIDAQSGRTLATYQYGRYSVK